MRCARATRHFIAETVTQQRSGGLAGHAHAAKGQVMCDMSESGVTVVDREREKESRYRLSMCPLRRQSLIPGRPLKGV